ncbi:MULTISPECIES: GNAT family N-acetyltransferase [unclassified Rhizobium]|jgi:GNAT superfamily N-acetyltransferase|uniref:GNAT family N-acetyltransferase n=1 Tax=unclassified Rhizobium TaxID=2613769 RepID=UPI000645D572|nr:MULTISPECIES: GNAT family N-acetyltransferase [unclassified Rhizobium]MBN8951720.1 GNAT family N-acetyltransferase [Rhizobium tropici]OJY74024.1 MAG: GNAT family N-acetyltransferase [Rhizobium sp. 60-20]RKD61616.1 acetyltransferase (GNAT) family protein [Rhizobium sp. WW_1]
MIVRRGCLEDLPWLADHDDASEDWIRRCIQFDEYFVAEQDGKLVGFLRFSRFWGKIPYMDMIRVLPSHQRAGAGSALFRAWESAMIEEGVEHLMTSSEWAEAEPQAWHRRNGFKAAGSIDLRIVQPSPEIFFVKNISGADKG